MLPAPTEVDVPVDEGVPEDPEAELETEGREEKTAAPVTNVVGEFTRAEAERVDVALEALILNMPESLWLETSSTELILI